MMMSVPPHEVTAKLSKAGKQKVENPEFYERLRSLLGQRYIAAKRRSRE